MGRSAKYRLIALLAGSLVSTTLLSSPARADSQVACDPAALVKAITAANSAGGDTLDLAPNCFYSLTSAGSDPNTALPPVTASLVIHGDGATIARPFDAPPFRLLEVASGGNLQIDHVELSDGLDVLSNVGGGGIYNAGSLTITSSTLFNDSTANGVGGAIYNVGTLTVASSTLASNNALGGGGAIYSDRAATGPVSVSSSTITGNESSGGGGIATISARPLTVTASTISDNNGGANGGGIFSGPSTKTPVVVTASTLSGNTAGGGGGIYTTGGVPLIVSESTFSGNTASEGGGAIDSGGTTTITASTLAGDSSQGTGSEITNQGTTAVSATIVDGAPSVAPTGTLQQNCSGTIKDDGYNIDTGSSCKFTSAQNSLNNANPKLGPLQDNGGPAQTMALQTGSAAIDQIPLTATAPTAGVGICQGTTDERGVSRPQGSACDIGAYELGGQNPPSGNGSPPVPNTCSVAHPEACYTEYGQQPPPGCSSNDYPACFPGFGSGSGSSGGGSGGGGSGGSRGSGGGGSRGGGSHPGGTSRSTRPVGSRLTLRATARRAGRSIGVRVAAAVIRPSKARCSGRVWFIVMSGNRELGSVRALVGTACHAHALIRFGSYRLPPKVLATARRKMRHPEIVHLRLLAFYTGNQMIRPSRSAAGLTLRYP